MHICVKARGHQPVSSFLGCFLPLLLRHSLSLNHKLANLAKLASQKTQRPSCFYLPSSRITDM